MTITKFIKKLENITNKKFHLKVKWDEGFDLIVD